MERRQSLKQWVIIGALAALAVRYVLRRKSERLT